MESPAISMCRALPHAVRRFFRKRCFLNAQPQALRNASASSSPRQLRKGLVPAFKEGCPHLAEERMQNIDDSEPRSISSASLSEAVAVSARMEDARAALAAQYRITSLFLKVGQVAGMLGLSTTAVHTQIREGRFPIAHRRVGNVIMVKLTDFVGWYCTDASEAAESPPQDVQSEAAEEAQQSLISQCAETPKEQAARIKRQVLEAMRLDSKRRAAATPTKEAPAELGARIHREALLSVRAARSNGSI